jgi:hypothetical protein
VNRAKPKHHTPSHRNRALEPLKSINKALVHGSDTKYKLMIRSELLVRIRVLLAEIPRETLNAVFLEWMKRLQKRVQVDGEYVG